MRGSARVVPSLYTLVFRDKRYRWRGSRSDISGCPDCHDKRYGAASLGFLHHAKQCMWMTKLECFVMWILEYPRQQIVRELHPARHDSIDSWIASFLETMSRWFQLQMSQGFDSALSQELFWKTFCLQSLYQEACCFLPYYEETFFSYGTCKETSFVRPRRCT